LDRILFRDLNINKSLSDMKMIKHILSSKNEFSAGLCEDSARFTLECMKKKKKRRLVLHFDVNETIMIGDEAGGDTYEDSMNKIVAKCALMKKHPISKSHSFEWKDWCWYDGTPLDPNGSVAPNLVFDWDTSSDLKNFHSMQYETNRKDFNSKIFTQKGQPGFVYLDEKEKLEAAMRLPKSEPVDERLTLNKKNYFIIPAFFKTLAQLEKEKRDFVAVIRTYGSDGNKIAKGINAWTEGKHPLFKGQTFSSLRVDLKNGLYVGKYDRVDKTFKVRPSNDGDDVVYNEHDMVTKLLSGKHGKVIVVQDDYYFWRDNGYLPGAGKPLWLSLDRPNTHHIFFDDHIKNDPDDSIVCIRYREDSKQDFVSLSGEKIRQQHGTFMVRVHALRAALDQNFFLERIAECEANYEKLLSLPFSARRKYFI